MRILLVMLIGVTVLGSGFIALPTLVVEWMKRESPDVVFHVQTTESVVALTLDDGPSSATREILEVLAEHDAGATFFFIGAHVREHPDLARRIRAEGHELGHHMMRDEPSIELAPHAFRENFATMDSVLDELGGSTFFRPGSGWYNREMVKQAASSGYRTVLGSIYPFDAHLPFPALASWYVREQVEPGAILVLHDGPERGVRTAETLRRVLPELKRKGYRVVPLGELLRRAADTDYETADQGENAAGSG